MIRLPLLVSVSGLAAFVILPIFACTTVIDDVPGTNPDGDGGTTDDGATTDDGGTGGDAQGDAGVDAGPFVQASHPAYPQVPHVGSGILSGMKLVTITAPGDPNAATYASFGNALVGSKWFTSIAKDYGLGVATSAGTFAGASLSGVPSLSAGQMENYIQNAITGNAAAAPDGHHMYIVYLPPGTGESNDPSCMQYGGYHQQYGGSGDGWGFVQHCTNPPGLTQLQWMTTAASHEIIEAATDTGQGWAFQANPPDPSETVWATLLSEVGDLCVGTEIIEGLYTYQRVWMNSLAASAADPCGPASTKAYYNTAPAAGANGLGWFPVTAGGSVPLPVKGFSTARIGDWVLDAVITKVTCGGCAQSDFTVTVTTPTSTTISGKMYPTINNGVTGTLTVTAKASVPSGSYAEIQLVSEPLTGGAGSDPYHVWPVGVYVP